MASSAASALFSPSRWDRIDALAGDASVRRYSRLSRAGRTAILVEYPESVRDRLARDLDVLSWCRDRGIRVPDVVAVDLSGGRAILEDLGTDDAETALGRMSPAERSAFVERALRPLERLAELPPDGLPAWNPPLDEARMRWELAGFELWFIRHHRSRCPSAELSRWLDDVASQVGRHPTRVCHRDYHLNNLLVSAGGDVGVIDIQDILVGPDTYDAVSLVYERSAVRLLSVAEQQAVLEKWALRTGARPGWRRRAELVRIQRGLKVLGTFARFVIAGDRRYEPWLGELSATLAELLAGAAAPPETVAFLLD
ncbi:MAG: phosphotransferase [Candidatus Sulfomarinibacteraceae bacterium]